MLCLPYCFIRNHQIHSRLFTKELWEEKNCNSTYYVDILESWRPGKNTSNKQRLINLNTFIQRSWFLKTLLGWDSLIFTTKKYFLTAPPTHTPSDFRFSDWKAFVNIRGFETNSASFGLLSASFRQSWLCLSPWVSVDAHYRLNNKLLSLKTLVTVL